jgi:uncharacterized membrane protein YvbJ
MLVCPKCNIEYDEGKKFCRKCGSFLLSEEGSTFETPLVELTELKKPEEDLFCPTCQTSYKKGKYCRQCGSLLVHGIPSQTPTIRSIEKSPIRKFSKEPLKSSLRPSPLLSAVAIIVLIISVGFFLWQRHDQISQPITAPPQSPPPSIEIEENEKIESLFEKIREANLNKNIDLFMSCYSIDFKDRKKKEIDTLESWKKFNYLDLVYHLKERTISGEMANVRVEWQMKVDQKGSKQPQDIKTILDVVLKREDDLWKIIEAKPGT